MRVWEYWPTMLHAKVIAVDGAWSSVGSVNFDNRSFQLNDEAGSAVQSAELADRLRRQFEYDLSGQRGDHPPALERAARCPLAPTSAR